MNSRRICVETRGAREKPLPCAMGTGWDSRTFPETVKRTTGHGRKNSLSHCGFGCEKEPQAG